MRRIAFQLILLAGFALPAYAQPPARTTARGDAHATALAEGVVRKVDRKAKTIILKHGPIANLGMGPMTMEFNVKDASLPDKIKPGDRVKFAAEKTGDEFTVTHLERAAK